MDEKILNAQIGDIVMVQHNSGSIYRCRILDIYYSRNDKNLPSPIDYIKFQLLSPKDGLNIFFANRDAIWAYCEIPVTKFKVGDKIIFNEKNIYGTIYKVRHGLWDYDVIEKDTGELWRVFEKEITGVWKEESKPFLSPPTDYLDYFRYFPKFSLPIFKNDAILRIDTDSIKINKEDDMNNKPRNHKFIKTNTKERKIKEVMFNGPATIIKWEPTMHDYAYGKTKGDKTVSVCGEGDIYDKEKGFLLAVIKEFVDNQSYDNILRMMDSFNDDPEGEKK